MASFVLRENFMSFPPRGLWFHLFFHIFFHWILFRRSPPSSTYDTSFGRSGSVLPLICVSKSRFVGCVHEALIVEQWAARWVGRRVKSTMGWHSIGTRRSTSNCPQVPWYETPWCDWPWCQVAFNYSNFRILYSATAMQGIMHSYSVDYFRCQRNYWSLSLLPHFPVRIGSLKGRDLGLQSLNNAS